MSRYAVAVSNHPDAERLSEWFNLRSGPYASRKEFKWRLYTTLCAWVFVFGLGCAMAPLTDPLLVGFIALLISSGIGEQIARYLGYSNKKAFFRQVRKGDIKLFPEWFHTLAMLHSRPQHDNTGLMPSQPRNPADVRREQEWARSFMMRYQEKIGSLCELFTNAAATPADLRAMGDVMTVYVLCYGESSKR